VAGIGGAAGIATGTGAAGSGVGTETGCAIVSASISASPPDSPIREPPVGRFSLAPRGNGIQLPDALLAAASAATKSAQVS
jgi:hypothetical protein